MARPVTKPSNRLSTYLDDDTARALYDMAQDRHETYTAILRRSIRLLSAVEDERKAGNQLMLADKTGKIVGKVVVL